MSICIGIAVPLKAMLITVATFSTAHTLINITGVHCGTSCLHGVSWSESSAVGDRWVQVVAAAQQQVARDECFAYPCTNHLGSDWFLMPAFQLDICFVQRPRVAAHRFMNVLHIAKLPMQYCSVQASHSPTLLFQRFPAAEYMAGHRLPWSPVSSGT